MSASQEVNTFCLTHRLGSREAFLIALCAEELAINIIEHSFTDGKKHQLELRAVVSDEAFTLRLRDNCREVESLLVIQTMGLDDAENGVTLSLAAAGDEERGVARLKADGVSVTAAMDRIRGYSYEQELFCPHVGRLLLGERAADQGIESTLAYISRSPALRLDMPLFVVRGGRAEDAVAHWHAAVVFPFEAAPDPAAAPWYSRAVFGMAGALQFLLYELSQGVIQSVLLQFLTAMALGYVSGCLYPIRFFPEWMQQAAQWLPTGCAVTFLGAGLTRRAAPAAALGLALYTALFAAAAIWLRRRRLAQSGG